MNHRAKVAIHANPEHPRKSVTVVKGEAAYRGDQCILAYVKYSIRPTGSEDRQRYAVRLAPLH
jgi:hypothetical protein